MSTMGVAAISHDLDAFLATGGALAACLCILHMPHLRAVVGTLATGICTLRAGSDAGL
ncbi:MAG TPA: hypothetical protein VJ835_01230 [Fimbriimonadaceae bacterium]|nr:hypothetical protein [Fimbriimonadaceae bacterium]